MLIFPQWPEATNLCTNGGFETDTTGWAAGGNTSIAQTTDEHLFGAASLQCNIGATQGGTLAPAQFAYTFPAAGTYTLSCFVKVPAGSAITDITFRGEGLTGSSQVSETTYANLGAPKDQWVRIRQTITVVAGDLAGFVVGRVTGLVNGNLFYLDGAQIETGSIATPYIETDGSTATRAAGPTILDPSNPVKHAIAQVS